MHKVIKTNIRFDGTSLEGKYIDIVLLTKSLLSLSALVNEANYVVNDEKTKVTIKVNAGVEQNCFELLLLFDLTLLEQAKNLITNENAEAIKNLLEWIGIFSATTYGGITFFSLIKNKQGKKIDKSSIIEESDNNVTIQGNSGPIIVNKNTYNIYNSDKVRKEAQNFIKPLQEEGIDTIEFETEGKTIKIKKDEVQEFLYLDLEDVTSKEEMVSKNITTRHLIPHKIELEESSSKWAFYLGDKSIVADISETNIAKDVIARGEVGVRDVYKVKIEEEEYKTKAGKFKTKYKILEVLEFTRAKNQEKLL